jgi:hypothetical protein
MPPSTRPQANRQQNLASVITSIDLNEFNHILPTTPHDDSNSDADSDLFSPQSFEAGIFSNRNPNMPVRRTAGSRARKRTATQAAADLGGDDADNEATEGAAAALEPSRKRRDTGTGRSSRRAQGKPIVIDDVDDENNDAEAGRLKETLQKQREEQVKAQLREEGAEPPRLNRSQCVICMDSFTDMTATSCGMSFLSLHLRRTTMSLWLTYD